MTAVLEVTSVSLPPSPPPSMLGYFIDAPVPGAQFDVHTLRILGWALAIDGPVAAVETLYHGRVVQRTSADARRSDVAARYSDIEEAENCGFSSLVSTLGFTEKFQLSIQAVHSDGTTTQLATLHCTRGPLDIDFEPKLQPLILTSMGRTGTTWLMQLMGQHPEIVASRTYPHEDSVAKYLFHALRVVAAPSSPHLSSSADDFHGNLEFVGHNPYYDDGLAALPELGYWLGRRFPERLAAHLVEEVDDWYAMLARRYRQPSVRFFAEKHVPGHLPVLMRSIYVGAREVFLVRDFRDVACSALAFNKKRGFDAFGAKAGQTMEQFLESLRLSAFALYRSWKARGDSSHLVRYEDLVLSPGSTLIALLEYLGADASPEMVAGLLSSGAAQAGLLAEHRTSESLEASVGRWRRDSDDAFARLMDSALGSVLDLFEYDRSPIASAD